MRRKLINLEDINTGFLSEEEFKGSLEEKELLFQMCTFTPYISVGTPAIPEKTKVTAEGTDKSEDSRFSEYYRTMDDYMADITKAISLVYAGKRVPIVLFYKLRLTYWEVIKFQTQRLKNELYSYHMERKA